MIEKATARVERILTRETRFDESELLTQDIKDTPASIALKLCGISMQFARTDRVPRYDDSKRESDVEHSFMLGLVATELASTLRPDLDIGLIHQYSSVHDMIELETKDVLTFGISPEDLVLKEQAEHDALEHLLLRLPPYIGNLLQHYELQADQESRFVRMVDKIMPVVVDILGDGVRIMKEDCDVHTTEQLVDEHEKMHARISNRFPEFPELHVALRQLYDLFEEESAEAFEIAA